jgi:hypothetical protein
MVLHSRASASISLVLRYGVRLFRLCLIISVTLCKHLLSMSSLLFVSHWSGLLPSKARFRGNVFSSQGKGRTDGCDEMAGQPEPIDYRTVGLGSLTGVSAGSAREGGRYVQVDDHRWYINEWILGLLSHPLGSPYNSSSAYNGACSGAVCRKVLSVANQTSSRDKEALPCLKGKDICHENNAAE